MSEEGACVDDRAAWLAWLIGGALLLTLAIVAVCALLCDGWPFGGDEDD